MKIRVKGLYLSHETKTSTDGQKTYHNAQVLLDSDETIRCGVKNTKNLVRHDQVDVVLNLDTVKGSFYAYIEQGEFQ